MTPEDQAEIKESIRQGTQALNSDQLKEMAQPIGIWKDTGLPCYQEDFHPEYHQMEGSVQNGQLIILISPKPAPRSPSIASVASRQYIPPQPPSMVSSVSNFKIQNPSLARITPTPPPIQSKPPASVKEAPQSIPPKPSYPPPSITSTKTANITVSKYTSNYVLNTYNPTLYTCLHRFTVLYTV